MKTDICARGFSLTAALRSAVDRQSVELQQAFPRGFGSLSVRLFDTNGTSRGGADKGCLIHARLRGSRASLIATAIDIDLYRAIAAAFMKLVRNARVARDRTRNLQRSRYAGTPAAGSR